MGKAKDLLAKFKKLTEGGFDFEIVSGPTAGLKRSTDKLKKAGIKSQVELVGGKGQEGISRLLVKKEDQEKAKKILGK